MQVDGHWLCVMCKRVCESIKVYGWESMCVCESVYVAWSVSVCINVC